MMSERDDYRGDVWYEEWRRGLPENSISDDRIADGYYENISPQHLVDPAAQEQANRRAERQSQAEELERQQYEEYKYWQEQEEGPHDD